MSPTASSTYALSYLEFKSATFAKPSDWMEFSPIKWHHFENLPNPSFIKYGVLRKFCSRFSRTSSREFSLIYFFISFSIFESTLVSLYSLSGLGDPGGLPITVRGFPRKSLCNRPQLDQHKSQIVSQLVRGRLTGELCRGAPTLYFVYPFYDILFQKTSILDFYRDQDWTEGHCFH